MLWFTNPRDHIRPELDSLIDLFFMGLDAAAWGQGASGIGAMRHLPESGGLHNQVAPVMDALRIIGESVREAQRATSH